MDGGATSPHHRAIVAQPPGSPVQQAPVAAQPFYHRFPRPPYQDQRPYQGRTYHPYQRGPVAAQGHREVEAKVEDLKFIRPNHLIFHRSWLSRISRTELLPMICILQMMPMVRKPSYQNLISNDGLLTEFRQPLQVQSHLEMPRILVQLGHTQRT